MKLRSLRARLIAGTVVWVVGVLGAAFVVGMAVLHFHPHSALLVHNSFMIVIGVVLVTAGVSVIRRGLSPFTVLRERLGDVRAGRTARLEGEYPAEVEPLVQDLNTLLEDREKRMAQAVAKAGDLAHGLKTPLAILMREIERAEISGQAAFAAVLREQVDRMRRQIDSHLAQARATAGGGLNARANVAQAIRDLVRAMERLHADRSVLTTVDVAASLAVRVPTEDLEEMLGNLLDNACKWATSRVNVTAVADAGVVTIDVDDDGAGLEPSMRQAVLRRGVRADQAAPGSGLGLAIVHDLADAYGGAIVLEQSPLGGLRARLSLPAQS